MKKNYIVLLIAFLCAFVFSYGQTKIAEITFESTGGYSTSVSEFSDGAEDYFTRTDGSSNISGTQMVFANKQGTYFFGAHDIDGEGGPSNVSLYIDNINITNYSSLELRIHIAEDDDGSNQDWDGNSYMHINGSIDSGTSQNILWVEAAGGTNTEPRIDTTFDGTGDGTAITDTFTQFTNSISGTGGLLDLEIIFNNLRNGDEDIAIDNIEIWGTPTSGNTITVTQATGGTITPGTTSVADNTDQSFTATPDAPCYTFSNWIVDGSNAGSTNPYTFTNVTTDHTITAVYNSAGSYNITASAGANGSISPNGVTSVTCGTDQSYTITPDSGYAVQDVLVDGVSVGAVTSYDFTNVTAIHTISVTFMVFATPCLSTGFESGEPTGWTNNSAYYNAGTANSGTQKAGMNGNNDWIRTEQLLNPSDLSFWARASGTTSNYTISIQYSTDGTTWLNDSQIIANGSNSGDITTTYQQFNINLNLTGNYYLRWLMNPRSGGSFYLDDVEVYCGTSTPEPELQLVDSGGATNQNCGYTIDFGSQGTSTNTDLTFDIENVGSLDLNISSFGITGDYSIVSPATPLTISAGNSQTVTVRFTPSTTGTRTGVLTINNDDTDEGSCTVNLTGDGFTPTPEIDIERNTGGSIPSGSAASTGYNTVFAATTMGSSSAPKTFHVSSEGTSDLNLTSIVSSNAAEFAITLNPGAATIPFGTEVDFEITFSPTGVGLRTATITILSDDADESPYTFNVQGNGNCAGATLTLLPDNGPVGSIVNISSSSSNFGVSTTASIGGISATVTLISASEIEVVIPAGAQTGSIEIDDDLGCLSSSLFTVIDQLISDCEGSTGTTPSDIFISEVTDHGSGSHSYIELFNGTGASVNLADYEIRVHNNGAATATNTIALSGMITNNDVFVIAFGASDATDPHATHGYDLSDIASGINEDDHIRLYNITTSTWIDLWGDTSGNSFTIASKDYTYRRKNSGIVAPSTTWDSNDWDSFTPVDYSDIGNYDFSTGVPPTLTVHPNAPSSSCDLTATISVTATEGFVGGNPLAYQWYYSAPGDSGWTAVPDNATYDDVNTNTLAILNTLNAIDYQFYCEVREDTATCYSASNAVKLNVQKAEWDGTQWLNSVLPDINTIAVINGDYETLNDGNFSACQLVINATHKLTIGDATFVEVENNTVVNGDLWVETHGAFVQNADLTNGFTLNPGGNALVNKTTTVLNNWYDYTYWRSPITDETIEDALDISPDNRRFWYNAQNYWDEYLDSSDNVTLGSDDIDDDGNDWQLATIGSIMTPGVGYAATVLPLGFTPRAYQATFEGEFNNGVITTPIYVNGLATDNDWNLIGNPYPSAIDFDDLHTLNNTVIDGAAYLWSHASPPERDNDGNEVLNFNADDYAIITVGSGNTAGSGPLSDNTIPNADNTIPSGQGFFVRGLASQNITFNNSMRKADIVSNNQFFRTSSRTSNANRLWIDLQSSNGVFNQILVAYVDGATNGFDGFSYDAPRNLSTGTASIIYTKIEDDHRSFAIQGKPSDDIDINEVIPFGFYTNIEEATIYTFSIPQLEGDFLENNTVYLHDKSMNIFHDLNDSEYAFTSEVGEFNDRFEIVFNPDLLSVDENEWNNGLSIIELQDGSVKFTVSNNLEIKNVKIYDTLGRLLYNLEGDSDTEIYNLSNLSQATYVAQVTLSNDRVITKKAVKRN